MAKGDTDARNAIKAPKPSSIIFSQVDVDVAGISPDILDPVNVDEASCDRRDPLINRLCEDRIVETGHVLVRRNVDAAPKPFTLLAGSALLQGHRTFRASGDHGVRKLLVTVMEEGTTPWSPRVTPSQAIAVAWLMTDAWFDAPAGKKQWQKDVSTIALLDLHLESGLGPAELEQVLQPLFRDTKSIQSQVSKTRNFAGGLGEDGLVLWRSHIAECISVDRTELKAIADQLRVRNTAAIIANRFMHGRPLIGELEDLLGRCFGTAASKNLPPMEFFCHAGHGSADAVQPASTPPKHLRRKSPPLAADRAGGPIGISAGPRVGTGASHYIPADGTRAAKRWNGYVGLPTHVSPTRPQASRLPSL